MQEGCPALVHAASTGDTEGVMVLLDARAGAEPHPDVLHQALDVLIIVQSGEFEQEPHHDEVKNRDTRRLDDQ
eukprot:733454-Rhodomonas_salina.4